MHKNYSRGQGLRPGGELTLCSEPHWWGCLIMDLVSAYIKWCDYLKSPCNWLNDWRAGHTLLLLQANHTGVLPVNCQPNPSQLDTYWCLCCVSGIAGRGQITNLCTSAFQHGIVMKPGSRSRTEHVYFDTSSTDGLKDNRCQQLY